MGATSVTGKGPGSAEGASKGPADRGTIGHTKVIGPHVLVAGEVTLDGTSQLVTLPSPLTGSEANYVVILTNEGAANALHVGAKTNNSDGNFASFTVIGTDTHTAMYVVLEKGH